MRGIWDSLQTVLENLGVNEQTSVAIQRALASPTMQNIRAVENAFAEAGTTAPPELMQTLYERYAQAVRDNPLWAGGGATQFISQNWPWLLLGVVGIIALRSSGRGK